jgi:hypothetical protein
MRNQVDYQDVPTDKGKPLELIKIAEETIKAAEQVITILATL